MGILSWIVVGLIVGWLALWFIPGFRFSLVGDPIIKSKSGILGELLLLRFVNVAGGEPRHQQCV